MKYEIELFKKHKKKLLKKRIENKKKSSTSIQQVLYCIVLYCMFVSLSMNVSKIHQFFIKNFKMFLIFFNLFFLFVCVVLCCCCSSSQCVGYQQRSDSFFFNFKCMTDWCILRRTSVSCAQKNKFFLIFFLFFFVEEKIMYEYFAHIFLIFHFILKFHSVH